ncbi:MAG: heparan-alpha-glucosaminide N-acetyltransferase domain-containing protein [Coriobacteriia bacterium]|nr:heparan-alpha-glucosaminide N-acetyltransferase domain-containing protein [Coriobacteriia bacterium]
MSETLLQVPPAPPLKRERVVSLDAARAIVVALMIFMDHPMIITALPDFLVHPDWHGFRLPDFVFPAFIYMAGVSLAYSVSRKKQMDFRSATTVFLRRIATLFGIGLGLNFFKYSVRFANSALTFAPLRIMGVLQRIALSSLIAWPFSRKPMRWALTGAIVLLLAHASVLLFVAPPGGVPGDLESKTENVSAWIDRAVLTDAHTYLDHRYDPEGVLGTVSSGALALLGLFVGQWLITWPRNRKRIAQLAGIGAVWIVLGAALSPVIPVNKQLWTPTFSLVAAGVATLCFVAMYWVSDLNGNKKLFEWLVPLGRNALLIYILSNVLLVATRVVGIWPNAAIVTSRFIPAALASLLFSAAEVIMWYFVAGELHRRKIYFKT